MGLHCLATADMLRNFSPSVPLGDVVSNIADLRLELSKLRKEEAEKPDFPQKLQKIEENLKAAYEKLAMEAKNKAQGDVTK